MAILKKTENRIRSIVADHRFENLQDEQVPARLTKIIGALADAITEDRQVLEPPGAVNLQAIAVTGAIFLSWDDVPRENIPSIDGVRIWRALVSADANQNFYANNAKRILVSIIRTTAWIDVPGDTLSRIYWIQHLNKDGREGRPSGGVTVAAL